MKNDIDELFYHYNGDDWRLFDPITYDVTNITIKTIDSSREGLDQVALYIERIKNRPF